MAKNTLPKAKIPPSRVIVDSVSPSLDSGRFPAKRAQGERMDVSAVVLRDGHDKLKCDLLYRHESESEFMRTPMECPLNDTWLASFTADKLGFYYFTVEASLDRFASWRDGFIKKIEAGEHSWVDFEAGYTEMGLQAEKLSVDEDRQYVIKKIEEIKSMSGPVIDGTGSGEDIKKISDTLHDSRLDSLLRNIWDDPSLVRFEKELPLQVDIKRGNFSAWYEFFPRSKWTGIAEQGNLYDAANRLDYIADLGFDVVYLPPIHPIGRTFRKGKNNALHAGEGEPGSPWAIGSHEGGHKSIHPELGTFDDFAHFMWCAGERGLSVALDIALQCSPDHPYVHENPQWFKKRADGSIQYAENPPKKYQDIVPFDFECADWKNLWAELKSIFDFWIEKGVTIFRVDNPHTKTFAFWEWMIGEIRRERPDILFLAEAFTKPDMMAYLAKIGFNQSYTYFAWRDNKWELEQYMTELTQTELKDYYRPNFWPNTPDILTPPLQNGGKPAAMARVVLASMLSSNYGLYGPTYELLDARPAPPKKVEYLDNEKYEIREWDVKSPHSIAPLLKMLNAIRKENPALHTNHSIKFHTVENDNIIAFTKQTDDQDNTILVIVNLDFYHAQSGIIDLQIQELGLDTGRPYVLEDLLVNTRHVWQGWRNYVELNPHIMPAHIFRVSSL